MTGNPAADVFTLAVFVAVPAAAAAALVWWGVRALRRRSPGRAG